MNRAEGSFTNPRDANGNRTSFSANGPTDTYAAVNNLNQYPGRNGAPAAYDSNGNMTAGFDGSSYVYDAQNRLTSASKSGTTDTFLYDGMNRQIGKKIGSQSLYYRVYDGWDLLGEYKTGTTGAYWAYLYGAGSVVKNLITNNYYYQDASWSTSHVANSSGALKEYYRYDVQGTPLFFNAAGQPLNDTAIGVRHLFAGQQWYSEIGLYDLRNRYYSPDMGRFLQSDPIRFDGDPTNLYRYCANNPVINSDPSGLDVTIIEYPASMFGINYNHVGISVNGAASVGFYPDHTAFDAPGVVQADPGTPIPDRSVTIQTTPAQDAAISAYIAQTAKNPPRYDGGDFNCTRFVEAALKAGNVKKVPKNVAPGTLIDKLRQEQHNPGTPTAGRGPGEPGGPTSNPGAIAPDGGILPGVQVINNGVYYATVTVDGTSYTTVYVRSLFEH